MKVADKFVDWCPGAAKLWPREFREWFQRLVGDGYELPVHGIRRRAVVPEEIANEVIERARQLGLSGC